jgi:hypothetical protein
VRPVVLSLRNVQEQDQSSHQNYKQDVHEEPPRKSV